MRVYHLVTYYDSVIEIFYVPHSINDDKSGINLLNSSIIKVRI